MFDNQFHISMLIAKQMRGESSVQEQEELDNWVNTDESNYVWYKSVTSEEHLPVLLAAYYATDDNAMWTKTIGKIQAAKPIKKFVPVKSLYRFRYQVSAAVALLVTALALMINTPLEEITNQNSAYSNDLSPGKSAATLTLADGRKINLGNADNGEMAKEAGVRITKTKDGTLVYNVIVQDNPVNGTSSNDETKQNTLSTAKGEMYQVVLPDKSVVWLNAASSLKYPSSFVNLKERRVILDGEAYFQITHNHKQPFRVQTADQLIEDIGTEFNVTAYADEPDTRTTLIEGSLRMNNLILKPGEQGVSSGKEVRVFKVDTEIAAGWKNGDFVFEGASLGSIMNQISRWYNVDLSYEGQIADLQFGGSISRTKSIHEVLRVLEMTKGVHFKIEGRRILVMP